MAKQRLILFFDGTWNGPKNLTNVYRMAQHVADNDGGIAQRFKYIEGVGTAKGEKLLGGATGYGLSKDLRQGYDWLARNYRQGDEIWVFGFSRGAYSARSLVGMISKCGLLRIVLPELLETAEAMYRDRQCGRDSPTCVAWRKNHCIEPPIHFIGVWDTVGSLGLPFPLARKRYQFHDTRLSSRVSHAYQALALDEHRKDFAVTLWSSPDGQPSAAHQQVEQRWFIGAHANVGGGLDSPNELSLIPFHWMARKAMDAGLKLLPLEPIPETAWATTIHASHREFMGGVYRLIKREHTRAYALCPEDEVGIHISVDESVWQRWDQALDGAPAYRPATLVQAGIRPPLAMEQTPQLQEPLEEIID